MRRYIIKHTPSKSERKNTVGYWQCGNSDGMVSKAPAVFLSLLATLTIVQVSKNPIIET